MSVMSAMSLRRHAAPVLVPASAGPVEERPATLSALRCGAAGTVTGVVADDPAVAQRLVDLGFFPGTPVETVRRAPLRDPVVYRVAGYEIALRKAQADCIRIAPTA